VLDATGVALTPGVDFAPATPEATALDGRAFVRLCFAGTTADLDDAMDRLTAYHVRFHRLAWAALPYFS
jgi:aspartate/methionine/tyrosine aminotransferase